MCCAVYIEGKGCFRRTASKTALLQSHLPTQTAHRNCPLFTANLVSPPLHTPQPSTSPGAADYYYISHGSILACIDQLLILPSPPIHILPTASSVSPSKHQVPSCRSHKHPSSPSTSTKHFLPLFNERYVQDQISYSESKSIRDTARRHTLLCY